MSDTLKILCRNTGHYLDIEGGENLLQLADKIGHKNLGLHFPPICAMVNNKNEGLRYKVFGPKIVQYLDRSSAAGFRVYTRSLCMMLYCAVRRMLPGATLRIEHSIAGGWYCRLFTPPTEGQPASPASITDALLPQLQSAMTQLRDVDLPFDRKERLTTDIRKRFLDEGLLDKVNLLDTLHELYTTVYRLDGVVDNYYGALAPSTGFIDTFSLVSYKEGFLLLGIDRADASRQAVAKTQEKMYEAFRENLRFNKIIGVSNVGQLNQAVISERTNRLINVAEALHDKKIAAIADEIAERYHEGGARVVLVAGPSSSGKTTFTKRLAIYLLTNLLEPEMISLDNYFVNRENTPRDPSGDYDYESLYALDLKQFNDDLTALLQGHTVEMPTYNFEKGCR